MRLEAITFDIHIKWDEVIYILLRVEQELSPHVPTMMNGHGGEYPCSIWNDIDPTDRVIRWDCGGDYPRSKSN